ncbi:MAG: hypothetical protein LBE09_00180 [Christensenellaceae bacterium]|nr:hypothetical protein [Christensenellaceae bacterium]
MTIKPHKARHTILLAGSLIFLAVVMALVVIVVNAAQRRLVEIEIKQLPSKTEYIERQLLDLEGLVIIAKYSNGQSDVVTEFSTSSGILSVGNNDVTVTYTEKGITKITKFTVTAVSRTLTEIEVKVPPRKLTYVADEYFEDDGIEVSAKYDNGEQELINDWDYDKKQPLTINDTSVTITYAGMTTIVNIIVDPKKLKSIMVSKLPQKVTYYVGEYFDFLGLELYAMYENANPEIIIDWDYDKKQPLTVDDTKVTIMYSLDGILKTIDINIFVRDMSEQDIDASFINQILALLPADEDLEENDLDAIEYVLDLLTNSTNLTSEQQTKKIEIEQTKENILKGQVPKPESEYSIDYKIIDSLLFEDFAYTNNPTKYKLSDGSVPLADPTSALADDLGYIFIGWELNGIAVTALENITQDSIIYAVFTLTSTVDILLNSYDNTDVVLTTLEGIIRTSEYALETNSHAQAIYSVHGILPIGYYSVALDRIHVADLSIGKTVVIYVKTAETRELHLEDSDSVSVSWIYSYTDDVGAQEISSPPQIGTAFVVPIGAIVTMISLHANITDITVDGVSSGSKLNNDIVQAVFALQSGEYPVSIAFATAISDVIVITFIGNNQVEYIYPDDWNGIFQSNELSDLAFVFDESNMKYLNLYVIGDGTYYYEDLSEYIFTANTVVYVIKTSNRFSLTVIYDNGSEIIDNLVGRQTLNNALGVYNNETTTILLTIFESGSLYSDIDFHTLMTSEDLLDTVLRGDLTVYSKWKKTITLGDDQPVFEDVDYSDLDFVGTWNGLLYEDDSYLLSILILLADGTYLYETSVNGTVSIELKGIYRLESGNICIKTLTHNYIHDLVTTDSLKINAKFADDGILGVTYIAVYDTSVMTFDHMMTRDYVRPANYYGSEFLATYEYESAVIELLANGTANITTEQNTLEFAYYRVDDNKLYIFNNATFGTWVIDDIIGGQE